MPEICSQHKFSPRHWLLSHITIWQQKTVMDNGQWTDMNQVAMITIKPEYWLIWAPPILRSSILPTELPGLGDEYVKAAKSL